MTAPRAGSETGHVRILLSELRTPPENEALYRPIRQDDPDIIRMAESILEHGLLHPLTVSSDMYVLDGNRRLAACRLAGIPAVDCRIRNDLWRGHPDFILVLREFNRQRDKNTAERIREELVTIEPVDAYAALVDYRASQADAAVQGSNPVTIGSARKRARITKAKHPMMNAIHRIIEERREYWPLSDRNVHYALLNDPPLKHASKPNSTYQNDGDDYKSLCDLLTRARLATEIPFEAIGDSTRPHTAWDTSPSPATYLPAALEKAFRNYWRDLLQSQPCHVEIWAEKLTVQTIVQRVAAEYTIPVTIGRGMASLDPRWKLAERYKAGGRDKLVLLVLTDHDPAGENILNSLASSIKDEFSIEDIHVVKVAITREQVQEMDLPRSMEAKEKSAGYHQFVKQYGTDAYELEAIPPAALQQILHGAIQSVLDMDLYRREQAKEKHEDAVELRARQEVVLDALRGDDWEVEP